MIALTCAATNNFIFFNQCKIIALETNTIELGAAILPVTRVWIGPGDFEYFVVKETPQTILEILRRVEDLKQYEH